jgi:hypothetical protein
VRSGPRPHDRCQRTLLAPAGHPAVDDLLVARPAVLGAEAEPFGDPRAEALDEDVALGDQVEHERDALGALEVDGERALAPVDHVHPGALTPLQATGHDPVDADHVGTEVGEQHRGERSGTEPCQLDHADTGERTLGISHAA